MQRVSILFFFLFILSFTKVIAQDYLGLGTNNPDRILDIEDNYTVIARVHAKTGGSSMRSGLMLIRGGAGSYADYQFINQNGIFQLKKSLDNFSTSIPILTMEHTIELGLGTTMPISRLHIIGDEEATNSDDGYMVIGEKNGKNLAFDPNEIIARDDGSASSLAFNANGGDIVLQNTGGNAYLSPNSGYVTAGSAMGYAKFNIGDYEFQLHLRNTDGALNDWYIGASESTWLAGDNQLLFSPSNNSNSAIFRLTTTTDNNGDLAPVVIRSSSNETLLMDGNEIDSKLGSLYFNYNSAQNTYINPSGGQVGIGTSNPSGTLHVKAASGQFTMTLEKLGHTWHIHPYPSSDNLGFRHNGVLVAHVDDVSGAWVALSDNRFKQDVRDAGSMLDKVMTLELKSYTFGEDERAIPQFGFLAQQVQEVLPELVSESPGGEMHVAYAQFSAVAIKALQEQDKKIEELENTLDGLLDAYSEQMKVEGKN